jgi:hypothetical protein
MDRCADSAATGVVQTGSHAALDAASAPRQEASTKTGEKADASRIFPNLPASFRHAEQVSGAAPGPLPVLIRKSRFVVQLWWEASLPEHLA